MRRDAGGRESLRLLASETEGVLTITTSVIAGSMLLLVAPVSAPCPCDYSFIGNGCCSYTWECQQVGWGPVVVSVHTEEITICVQNVTNCAPCASAAGSCAGTITYTDTGGTSAMGNVGLQAGWNNALKNAVGPTFNVSVGFSAGSTTSTSVTYSQTYECRATVVPCQNVTAIQKLIRTTVSLSAPVAGRTSYMTHGLRPDADPECNPQDCPVGPNWIPVEDQVSPCYTGESASATGSDDVRGECSTVSAGGCPSPCRPCASPVIEKKFEEIQVP